MISSISMTAWDSKSELLAHLRTRGPRALVVGNDVESPREYASCSFVSPMGRVEVGVISSGLGARPAAIALQRGRGILVGHDSWVSWIDCADVTVTSSCRLGGVFYEFVPVADDDHVVVLHELGVLRVNSGGSVIWSVDTDVVEDSHLDGNGNLLLTIMDGPELIVSLTTGTATS
jgi:hypothetical protein